MQREERAQDSVSLSRIPWKVGTYCEIWDCNTIQQWLYQHQYGVRMEGQEEIQKPSKMPLQTGQGRENRDGSITGRC